MRMNLKIYFDDGEKISWKEGLVSSEDDYSITIDHKHIIPRGRIVRMEVCEDGKERLILWIGKKDLIRTWQTYALFGLDKRDTESKRDQRQES